MDYENLTTTTTTATAVFGNNETWNWTNGSKVATECDSVVSDGLVEFLIYGVLLNVISLLGIMGNGISMIVLSRPQMKSSINYLLIGLATCDTLLILLSVSSSGGFPFYYLPLDLPLYS